MGFILFMANKAMSPNHREIISALSTITSKQEYLTSTGGALNINGSFTVTGGATSANQTNGQQLVQIVDAGGEAATVTGGKLDVNATASLAGSSIPISGATTAVGVAIVDGSGNQITSFGGGTQYTNGGTPPTNPIGPTLEFNNAGTWATVGSLNPLPVSASNPADNVTTGTISAADAVVGAPAGSGATVSGASTAGSLVALQCSSGSSSWMIQTSGTFGGTAVYFEASADSTNGTNGTWISVNGRLEGINNTSIAQGVAGAAVVRGTVSSFTWIRVRAVGGSGISIAARIEVSSGTGAVFLNASLPTGTNVIGHVIADTGSTTAITGTVAVTQSTSPWVVSNSGTFAVQATLAAETTKVIGTVNQGTNPWVTSNATTSVVGNGAAATAQRVTLANDSTGVIATVGAVTAITNALPTGTNSIGKVGTTSAIVNVGQQTVSTTAVQISSTSTVPTNGIIVRALSTNSASVFVGDSSVTTSTGFELVAGESMSFTANLNTLYIRSVASTTDKICWNVE